MYKKYLSILFCVFITTLASAQKHEIDKFIKNLSKDSDLKAATISLKIVNTETKETLFAHNSNYSMVPASIQKVVTTGLALTELGKDFHFETKLAYSGEIKDSTLFGNLYIIGGGDPSFASPEFEDASKQLIFSKYLSAIRQKGIRKIEGKVIADATYFSEQSKHPTWEWEDIGTYYGTGVSGLNFEENFFSLYTSTNTKGGDSVIISTKSELDSSIVIVNKVNLVHQDSASGLSLYSSPYHPEKYILTGNLPRTGNQIKMDCAMQSPAENCVASFTRYLINNNLTIQGNTINKSTLTHLYSYTSPSITELTTYTNFVSNNLFADAFAKQLAKKTNNETTFAGVQKTMKQILDSKFNTDGVKSVDGSGLSRHNYVTADFMCDFLQQMNERNPDFIYNLAVPGESKSTLRNFMNTYKNKANFNLKSGSMTGVLSYTGYVNNTKSERLCVTLIINNFSAKASTVRKKVEKLMSYIPNM